MGLLHSPLFQKWKSVLKNLYTYFFYVRTLGEREKEWEDAVDPLGTAS